MFTYGKAMKGLGYVTETQVNGKQSKTVETEQYAPIMLLCYCPKEAYVHISNYAFKKVCKNSLHYHALASGEEKKKMAWISLSDRLWNVWEGIIVAKLKSWVYP